MARRSNQRVLPPCAPGPLATGFVIGAVHAPGAGLAARIIWRRPGGPRGPPNGLCDHQALTGTGLVPGHDTGPPAMTRQRPSQRKSDPNQHH
jgi:hypothetical protein